jgi:hypothetical protein
MIVVVRGKRYKRLAIKALSYIGLIVMFYFYYLHMSDKFSEEKNVLVEKLDEKGEKKKVDLARTLERLIYKEAEMVVALLDQTKVREVKILENKLYILCDSDTDTEPLLVRYGVNAMMKHGAEDIKIAIDLKFIVESKYES